MLNIQNYTKRFGDKIAVDDLSLHIAAGEICAFIGHNGAGKTTTWCSARFHSICLTANCFVCRRCCRPPCALSRCPVHPAHRSSASPCSLNRILHPAIFCTPPCLSGDSSHITSSCCSARSSLLSISSCLVAAESRKRRSLQEKNNSTRFGAARRSCAVFMFFYDIFPCAGKH